jgi:hypothetical protein
MTTCMLCLFKGAPSKETPSIRLQSGCLWLRDLLYPGQPRTTDNYDASRSVIMKALKCI